MIYFDNAATTLPKPDAVIEAVRQSMLHSGNANRGTHEGTLGASQIIFDTRRKLAAAFGLDRPDHVVFTSNATESLNIALNGLFQPGDHVISTDLEHNSVLRPLYRLEKEKLISLSFIGANPDGTLRYEELEEQLRPETRCLVCSHASNVTGNLSDLQRLGSFAHEHGLIFLVDAAQTGGSIPISMRAIPIDILCLTGHKGLLGPQGTGALLINGDCYIRPFKTGGTGVQSALHEQPDELPTRLEAGTLNSHGIAGLSAALDFISERGMETIHQYEKELMLRFIQPLREIPGLRLYGNFEGDRTAVVSLNIGSVDSSMVSDVLFQDYQIATRPGAHCAPRMHRALGTSGQGTVRFSFSLFNTEEEVDFAVKALKEIAEDRL